MAISQTDFQSKLSKHFGIPKGAGIFREMLYSPIRHFFMNDHTKNLAKALTAVPMEETTIGALRTRVARCGNFVCYTKPEAV